jgi:hypothetical protein
VEVLVPESVGWVFERAGARRKGRGGGGEGEGSAARSWDAKRGSGGRSEVRDTQAKVVTTVSGEPRPAQVEGGFQGKGKQVLT